MRAARWHGRRDIRVEEVPDPLIRDGEVMVAVELCGICGSDMEEYLHGPITIPVRAPHLLTGGRAPVVLGHEIVGTVVECRGDGPPVGSRVVPEVVLGCGRCWWCLRHEEGLCERTAVIGLHRDGGLAEYVTSPAANCVVVPEGLAAETAVFAEPAAVAVRAVRKAGYLAGATAVVNGAGTIGVLVAQAARAAGAGHVLIVDPAAARRDLASQLRADGAAAPDQGQAAAAELTEGRGADVVFECAGVLGAVPAAARMTRRGGLIVLVGIHDGDEPLPLLDVVVGEKRLVGSAAHNWDEDVAGAVALLAAELLDPTVIPSTRVSLDRVVIDGFDAAGAPRKIIVDPTASGADRR